MTAWIVSGSGVGIESATDGPTRPFTDEVPLVDEPCEDLFHEERIPFGPRQDLRAQRGRKFCMREEPIDELFAA